MTLLLFGRSGQLACEIRALATVEALGRDAVDLSDPAACATAILERKPSAVINAAAYTAVDRAEEEEELATLINGAAPSAMAKACVELGIPFVNVSTDYVFDGSGDKPIGPDRAPLPVSAYGRSKLAGERGVAEAGGACVTLRTSWVFSSHGQNFVKTMLRLGAERDALDIVADQIGGPTPARSLAKACIAIAEDLQSNSEKAGTYHYAGLPDTSWADFAREIFAQAYLDCRVSDIATADYPTAARRPLNSRLDCAATEAAFGISRPDWKRELGAVIEELKIKGKL